jgi:hypothetical protein
MRRSQVILVALATLLAAAPAADAKRKRTCSVRGAAVIAKNRAAVVLSRSVQFSELEDGIEYYGCIRKRRRPVYMESESSDQYSSSSVNHLLLRGTMVVYDKSTGFIDGSCLDGVNVFSIGRRRQIGYGSATGSDGSDGHCPAVSRLVANRAGVAAWAAFQGGDRFVRKIDSAGQGTLDQGAGIDPNSLSLAGATLSWTNAGEARTAQLR